MKITIIGGGAWGTTLGQILTDNKHEVLINEVNHEYITKIKNNQHPIFNTKLNNIKATNNLKEALQYSDIIILSLPTKFIRLTLKKINNIINNPKNFINASKGIEINNFKTIYQLTKEEISKEKIKNYGCIMGPSHAEEVILRKLTLLVATSSNYQFAKKIQKIFFNPNYLRVYSSTDINGVEICSAFKNVLAFISGILDANNLGYNLKAAFLSRSLIEMSKITTFFKGKKQTVFGLTGLGDLIVTAFNGNSRNYQAGKKFGMGQNIENIVNNSKQVIEGINNLKAFYLLSKEKKIELPIIQESYKTIFENQSVQKTIYKLFNRPLKNEKKL